MTKIHFPIHHADASRTQSRTPEQEIGGLELAVCMFGRVTTFLYGVLCYLFFFGTYLYAIGFFGNFAVPKSLDSRPTIPFDEALLTNATLLTVFSVQHSVMARTWFKRIWTRIIPEAAERSTY